MLLHGGHGGGVHEREDLRAELPPVGQQADAVVVGAVGMATDEVDEAVGLHGNEPVEDGIAIVFHPGGVHVFDGCSWVALGKGPAEVAVVAGPTLLEDLVVAHPDLCDGHVIDRTLRKRGDVAYPPVVEPVGHSDAVPLEVHAHVEVEQGVVREGLGDVMVPEVPFEFPLIVG